MRLLERASDGFRLTKEYGDNAPPYAILSHRWGEDEDEIKLQDLDKPDKTKPGYKKLEFCCAQAEQDGLQYFWVDTCCIDKTSSADLDRNINSMFRYYRDSTQCYVYLSDISLGQEIGDSEWFDRGWTLQELIAPRSLKFYARDGRCCGTRTELQAEVCSRTRIPAAAFGGDLSKFTKDERMKWLGTRQTREKPDRAYCMLGIFGVSMRLDYSEDETSAFERLDRKFKKSVIPTIREIDESIGHYYFNRDQLVIERLSGEILPMERCYINLGIVNYSVNGLDYLAADTSDMSLTARLKVDSLRPAEQVDLKYLFDPRNASSQSSNSRRVLIWGRAGVGKTTLCKKIVHDFYRHGLWRKRFTRIFWISLRKLKPLRDRYMTIVELVKLTCFGGMEDDVFPTETMKQTFTDSSLFLLDGLDEISSHYDPDTILGAHLNSLLGLKNVVVTSRPQSTIANSRIRADIVLETIGFYPAQVEEYIRGCRGLSSDQSRDLQDFIKRNPIVRSLTRIPVMLDAICYCWTSEDLDQDDMTMTKLYRMAIDRLWRKDIVRIQMKRDGDLLTEQDLRFHKDVGAIVRRENVALEELAFIGMCNQQVEFEAVSLGDLAIQDEDTYLPARLSRSSFLRSSDSMSGGHQTYHFIHLTFQEFFAAQYYVRQWQSRRSDLLILTPNGTDASDAHHITPIQFVEKEKFNERYNIFWRFVTGLLSVSNRSNFNQYLDIFQSTMADISGRGQQSLIASCLNEVAIHERSPVVERLERCYGEWACFEYWAYCNSSMIGNRECPASCLIQWLEHVDRDEGAAYTLAFRDTMPTTILKSMLDRSMTATNQSLSWTTATALAIHGNQLYGDPTFEAFVLRYGDTWIQKTKWNSSYSSHMLFSGVFYSALIGILQVPDHVLIPKVLSLVHNTSEENEAVIDAVREYLKNTDHHGKLQALETLARSATFLPAFEFLLHDPNPEIRTKAIAYFMSHREYPIVVIEHIKQGLFDAESEGRVAACQSLLEPPMRLESCNLPSELLVVVAELTQDRAHSVRKAAARILQCQRNPDTSLLQCLDGLGVQGKTWLWFYDVQNRAEHGLLSDADFDDAKRFSQEYGVEFLCHTQELSRIFNTIGWDFTEYVLELLQYPERFDCCRRACTVLEGMKQLPGVIVDKLAVVVDLFDCNHWGNMFHRFADSIPWAPIAYSKLVRGLFHGDSYIRWTSMLILDDLWKLPEAYRDEVVYLFTSACVCPLRSEPGGLWTEAGATFEVMYHHVDLAKLISRLDTWTLAYWLLYWLEGITCYDDGRFIGFHADILTVKTLQNTWIVELTRRQAQCFWFRWRQAQKLLGVPPFFGQTAILGSSRSTQRRANFYKFWNSTDSPASTFGLRLCNPGEPDEPDEPDELTGSDEVHEPGEVHESNEVQEPDESDPPREFDDGDDFNSLYGLGDSDYSDEFYMPDESDESYMSDESDDSYLADVADMCSMLEQLHIVP